MASVERARQKNSEVKDILFLRLALFPDIFLSEVSGHMLPE